MNTHPAPLRLFDTGEDLGAYAAGRALDALRQGLFQRERAVLGCPGGRSPRATYTALAQQLRTHPLNGALLHLVMMDEYIVQQAGAWQPVSPTAHYSCARFGERDIRQVLNPSLTNPVPPENLHIPPAAEPLAYEDMMAALGGIDLFLLASGASDGHVAFNPPGTMREEKTRRVRLADSTRRDNMKTFPDFRALDEVPLFGVSVGPDTIARHSRNALLILSGAEKGAALARVLAARSYDPDWPSTIVHDCRNAEILADRAAFDAMPRSG